MAAQLSRQRSALRVGRVRQRAAPAAILGLIALSLMSAIGSFSLNSHASSPAKQFTVPKLSPRSVRIQELVRALEPEFEALDYKSAIHALGTHGVVDDSDAAALLRNRGSVATDAASLTEEDVQSTLAALSLQFTISAEESRRVLEDLGLVEALAPLATAAAILSQPPRSTSTLPPQPSKWTGSAAELWSSSDSPWFESGRRYLTYQPSGGISNQLKMLEWAIAAAAVLNRTILIPPAGPHTTRFWKYNEVEATDTVPMDEVIDLAHMHAGGVPALALRDVTFLQFVDANFEPSPPIKQVRAEMLKFIYHKPTPPLPPEVTRVRRHSKEWVVVVRDLLRVKRPDPWSSARLSSLFGGERGGDVLYFSRATMWQNFDFSEAELRAAQLLVRPQASINRLARELSYTLGARVDGRFNCLHIRFPDDKGGARAEWLRNAHSFMQRMVVAKFKEASPDLYIATHPAKRKDPFFKKIKLRYNVTFSDQLPQTALRSYVQQFSAMMQPTMLGMVEQSLCARAHLFLGTGYSTFSEVIRRLRHDRATAVANALPEGATAHEVAEEDTFLRRDTPCTSPMSPC